MYMEGGRIKGGYAIRALVPKMKGADAEKVKEMLAPLD